MSDEDEESYSAIRTILGRTHRDQRWHLTDEVDVLTALGSAKFDLRSAEPPAGEAAEISVKCFLGKVDLIVPAGTIVILDGTSFLASAYSDVAEGEPVDLPRLEVTATTVLGRVRVRSVPAEEEAVAAPVDQDEPAPEAASTPDPFVVEEPSPAAVAAPTDSPGAVAATESPPAVATPTEPRPRPAIETDAVKSEPAGSHGTGADGEPGTGDAAAVA